MAVDGWMNGGGRDACMDGQVAGWAYGWMEWLDE